MVSKSCPSLRGGAAKGVRFQKKYPYLIAGLIIITKSVKTVLSNHDGLTARFPLQHCFLSSLMAFRSRFKVGSPSPDGNGIGIPEGHPLRTPHRLMFGVPCGVFFICLGVFFLLPEISPAAGFSIYHHKFYLRLFLHFAITPQASFSPAFPVGCVVKSSGFP